MIAITQIIDNKKQFIDLLLLADEQESIIDRYLNDGTMFALYDDNDLKSICVVSHIDNSTCELKNIAVYEKYQGQGYGKRLIEYISNFYKGRYQTLIVGTGETPSTLSFYQSCGFEHSHIVENFFLENYDHPIVEEGILLTDMIYLTKSL